MSNAGSVGMGGGGKRVRDANWKRIGGVQMISLFWIAYVQSKAGSVRLGRGGGRVRGEEEDGRVQVH